MQLVFVLSLIVGCAAYPQLAPPPFGIPNPPPVQPAPGLAPGVPLPAPAVPADQGTFIRPSPTDGRGPCPMMNTLANHGFLPRDGLNLTKENVVQGLTVGLNFEPMMAGIMWDKAIVANPQPGANQFTLEQLNVHNVLEHDASLSRPDAAFGNQQAFNVTIFALTTTYWTDPILTANMLANSKVAQQLSSKSLKPNYNFTNNVENFSRGEVAGPILVFGDREQATVRRDLVVDFFVNERLPVELGWTKPAAPIGLNDILRMSTIIGNASNLITGPPAAAAVGRKRGVSMVDLHSV